MEEMAQNPDEKNQSLYEKNDRPDGILVLLIINYLGVV